MRELLFDPVSREERLRRELDRLRTELAAPPPPGMPATLALDIGDAWIVTPEGRVAIPCLQNALAASREPLVVVDAYEIHAAEHVLATTYGSWVRYRLDRVLSLRQGDARPMLPAAIATVLLLLINGNVDRAMARPSRGGGPRPPRCRRHRAYPGLLLRAVEGGKRADPRHWKFCTTAIPVKEARRRLGNDIVSRTGCCGSSRHQAALHRARR